MSTNNETCSQCETEFTCGAKAGEQSCWCAKLPKIIPLPESGSCLCPKCLEELIKKHEETKIKTTESTEEKTSENST